MLVELSSMSAGSLFFGVVLFLVRKRQPQLIESIVLAIGSRWRHLEYVAEVLSNKIDEVPSNHI